MSYKNELTALKEKQDVLRKSSASGRSLSKKKMLAMLLPLILLAVLLPNILLGQEPAENQVSELAENELSVEELIEAYNSVEVKAEDATLNIILGLYKKYKGTENEKIITGKTIMNALDKLGAGSAVPLKKMEYILYDRETIVLVFKKSVKEGVPGTLGAASIELSTRTKWKISAGEEDIIVITRVEGGADVKIAWALKAIAKQYGMREMEIHNAALTIYEHEGKKSLYGAVFSEEKSKDNWIYLGYNENYNKYNTLFPLFTLYL